VPSGRSGPSLGDENPLPRERIVAEGTDLSSEGVAYGEERPVAYGNEPPVVEDLPAEDYGGGRFNWLLGIAIVLPVLVLYAALGYVVYVVARTLL
jgi:hypothetical protein